MKYKTEFINWIDSKSQDGWFGKDHDLEPGTIISIGFVIKETDEFISLAGHYSESTEQYSGAISIPKLSIINRKPLIVE